uniref:MD-2-related lipid-recognition domain-containing protein n=1 Tax=Stomoxys calcitrans TaxID=35570 RepID=A0A1I8P3H8_STOCA
MKAVYYLKILLSFLILAITAGPNQVAGGTIAKYAEEVRKKILMARSLPFQDCGSRYLILYLKISSCSEIPCTMYRGTTVHVDVIFDDDDNNTTFLKHEVQWILNSIKTDAHITPDPCEGDEECISTDNDGKSYWASVLVNSTLPTITGTMKWEAVNQYFQKVLCFKVPITIKSCQKCRQTEPTINVHI